MRIFLFGVLVSLFACHKQVGGPRKLEAVGHIEYSFSTSIITKVYYNQKKDDRRFTIKLNKDHTISGDVNGTWAESGAQLNLNIEGDFGPNSPFQVDYGYYETRDFIAIEGHEINMRDFVEKTYFIAVTKGSIGNNLYYRQFVFE